jgi:glycosyltransferase involved in cell wall biosynthesis
MSKRLMVMPAAAISGWITKGEVVDRYYNPGDLFDEVHLVFDNDDRPDPVALQRLVGRARPFVHNIAPPPHFGIRTLGWRPWLLSGWTDRVAKLAGVIRPDLVRCHGAQLHAFAAAHLRRSLGIPYAVSLHINPADEVRGLKPGSRDWLYYRLRERMTRVGLRNADVVLPVYMPIVPYLKKIGVRRYRVAYNVLNHACIVPKASYRLHNPVRIVSVGRQFDAKNPDNLIRAVARIDGATLQFFGDGPLHDYLRRVAEEVGAKDRISFERAVPNDVLCRHLAEADIFAVHSDYGELSKAVIEPLLTGLPVICNRKRLLPVPELTSNICVLVENTVEGYETALRHLISDDHAREMLGKSAFAHAWENWAPERSEARFASIYRHLLNKEPIGDESNESDRRSVV